ncbi:hypothetical protein HKCCSP123_14300, partial [Rhodobacterales bacterium HKCCSP123]|nr:hypothetical protein [Rhodobacterales bacterium HKCCSP123]
AGNDTLRGGAENDRLFGGAGSDILEGGAGDDTLFGALDTDTFVFGTGHGTDVIRDFDANGETIDLTALGTTFAALVIDEVAADEVLTGVGAAVRVETGQGTILLEGVALADVTQDDFLFIPL